MNDAVAGRPEDVILARVGKAARAMARVNAGRAKTAVRAMAAGRVRRPTGTPCRPAPGLQRPTMPTVRMDRPAGAVVVAVAFAIALAGCASPVPNRFHSLLSTPGEAAAPPPQPKVSAPVAWTLARVAVPAQVERPQWVVRAPDGTLAVLEQERWIAPLADEIQAAVGERLTAALGSVQGAPPATGRTAWRIELGVERFDMVPARLARLDASWTVGAAGVRAVPAPAAGAAVACRASFEIAVAAGYPPLAAAQRQAVARLADAVAASVAALEGGSAKAACPP